MISMKNTVSDSARANVRRSAKSRLYVAASATALLLALSNPALSQESSRKYQINISPATVAEGLRNLEVGTGISLVFSPSQVQDLRTEGVRGQLTIDEALNSLLAGTGLVVKTNGKGAYVILGPRMGGIQPTKIASVAPGEILVAQAQTSASPPSPPSNQTAQGGSVEEVIVTGSRIIRDGYEAPTPLTVVNAASLAEAATGNVATQLATMPVFSGSLSPQSGAGTPSFNTAGVSGMNLRSMGLSRTLVLLDGQRSVPTLPTGVVDVGDFPQQLVSRVDVVTGGASAVYGSDAVTGVVNFVLDKEFTGVKGEVSGGVTTYGDDPNWKVSLAAGFPFAGGRGHVLLSGEMSNDYGIVYGNGPRTWASSTNGYILNPAYGPNQTPAAPANGVPQYLLRSDVFLSQATHGGLITSGPLKGIAFGENGVPYQFNYGTTVARDLFMSGGDYLATRTDTAYSLQPSEARQNLFVRTAYDVTDDINVFFQASYANSNVFALAFPHYSAGTGYTIKTGNAFIPASVQAQMTALGLASIPIGSMNYDMPFVSGGTERSANRYVVGANGRFDLFDTKWSWNGYVQAGETRTSYNTYNVEDKNKLALAIDAVRAPNGTIVCRITLTQPNNGCVPWNVMGTGVNDELARQYLLGTAHANQSTTQTVYSASVTGEPFSNWAGPVSLALSLEHRQDGAKIVVGQKEIDAVWRSGNLQPLDAKFNVTEGAIETVIPIAKDASFAESWDFTAAFRGTSYSLAGYVSTWKVGTTYSPVSDIRVRATRSRDIRAPNITELFQAQNLGLGTSLDPGTNTSPTYVRLQNGNPKLKSEIADTTDVGVVVQPRFLPGFSASVDYWDIKLNGAITQIAGAQVLLLCYTGRPDLCPNIIRNSAGVATAVQQGYFNFAVQHAKGLDLEASYEFLLSDLVNSWDGKIRLHTNMTHYIKNLQNDNLSPPNDTAGTTNLPAWVSSTQISYSLDSVTTSLTGRAYSKTVLDNDFIQCTTGCPTSNTTAPTFDKLGLAGGLYLDWALTYKWESGIDTFLNVKNIMNKDPGLVPARGDSGLGYIYSRSGGRGDLLGRVFRAGVRFKM